MGRHRRSGPATGGRITHRRPRQSRAGLLGASAALTVGAVAAGAGLLPGAGSFDSDGGTELGAQDLRGGQTFSGLDGGTLTPVPDGGTGDRAGGPEPREDPTETATEPETEPSSRTPRREPSSPPEQETQPAAPETTAPSPSRSSAPRPTETATPSPTEEPSPTASRTSSRETAAAEAVLSLVNQERARAGCQPLTNDADLAELATAHSRDMAERGFFSHDDPQGRSPWDRAAAAGVTNLAAENIAYGYADAQAVMEGWMDSDGHRANILNCDYRTLGVGVYFAEDGPRWTQSFGF